MPTYVYRCETCGLTFERRQSMMDVALTDCPECAGKVHRVIQPVPIFFRGPGFYVTDNKRSGSTASMPDNGREPQGKGEEEKTSETSDTETKSSSAE